MNIQEKIRAMVKHIQEKSDEELEIINENARKRSDEIKKHYSEASRERYNEIVEKAEREAMQIIRKQSARSELEASKLIMEARAKILETAIDEVRKKAEEVISSDDYPSVLTKLITEALETLDEKSVVLKTNFDDRETVKGIVAKLKKENPGIQIGLAEENAEIKGGIIAESSDGRVVVVNTIAKKVEESREDMAFLLFNRLEKMINPAAKNR
ncbi:MAG: hypothetical protein DRP57_10245 [Spirochaetes bacterium]|nr:MAG: hypothetical protein DRP57_10245 [Spirochaetota bacterium]